MVPPVTILTQMRRGGSTGYTYHSTSLVCLNITKCDDLATKEMKLVFNHRHPAIPWGHQNSAAFVPELMLAVQRAPSGDSSIPYVESIAPVLWKPKEVHTHGNSRWHAQAIDRALP